MTKYALFIVRNGVTVVVGVLIASCLLGVQVRHLQLQIRRRAQLPEYHPYIQIQNRSADLFGGDTTLIVGLIARQGDIFTVPMLSKIARLTAAIDRLPGVIPENVLSIASPKVKSIRSSTEGLDIRPLMEEVPDSSEDIARLKDYVLAEPLYSGTLVSTDGKAAAIIVDFDDSVTDPVIHASIERLVSNERDEQTEIVLAGAPLIRSYVSRYTALMRFLFPIAVFVIGIVHYEAFRTFQAMFLPLVTALLSVTWALGIMGLLRQPMDTWSAVTPVVILAVAAGHAVQVLKRYYEEYDLDRNSQAAVVRSLAAVGPVMITACAIASAGFASLATFRVASVRVFGMLLAFGILSALVIEMTFTPACRALLPAPRGREIYRQRGGRFLAFALNGLARTVIGAPRYTLAAAVIVAGASFFGASRLKVDNSFRGWFPADAQIRRDDAALNARFAGTSTLRILIEGEHEGDVVEPAVLSAISDLESFLRKYPEIGAATSIADYVLRMHVAMNGERSDARSIPENKRLIAQYLFLYSLSGPSDLDSIIDPSHRVALVRAYAKTDEAEFGRELFVRLRQFVATRFAGLPVSVGVAGGALGVQTAMNEVIVREKIINMVQVSVIVFTLAALALRSLLGGLIVLLPLILAVIVNLGAMGWSNTWLSMATASITSMGVSIGADFAIYLIFRIREEVPRHGSLEAALHEAISTSGKAIFFVSSAVALGYLTLAMSGFSVWINLGVLTALMMAVSAVGSLTLIPAIAMVARPRVLVAPRSKDGGESR